MEAVHLARTLCILEDFEGINIYYYALQRFVIVNIVGKSQSKYSNFIFHFSQFIVKDI